MKLFVAGLSYKTAPVELREKLAVAPGRLPCHGCRLKLGGGLTEVVVVSTCNRVEIYGVTTQAFPNAVRLFQELSGSDADVAPYLYVKEGLAAVKHLLSVAGGLDSMVLGETEITGQVKQAYQNAQAAKLTGRVTNRLFQTALQVAKEIRTETGIGRGATSVGSVAVELAERIFDGRLAERTILIVGAGKMGEACVKHLAKKGAGAVLVANRSLERARGLAAEFGGEAIPFAELGTALGRADIVVTSTGAPQTILHRAEIEAVLPGRRNRPLFLIDIAVPRDVDTDVQTLPNVFLYNVDHLENLVQENVRQRQHELAKCEAIIQERSAALLVRFAAGAAAAAAPAPHWAPGAAVLQS